MPDHVLGSSFQCPTCGNFFTLAPADSAVVAAPLLTAAKLQIQNVPSVAVAPPVAMASRPPVVLVSAEPQPRQRAKPKGVDPIGLSALVLVGAAVFCATPPRTCVLVAPLAVLAVLVGAAGAVLALVLGGRRLVFSTVSVVLGCALFLVALASPSWLGPAYQTYRERDVVDPNVMRAMPLHGQSSQKNLGGPDWVDASRAALQQGRLRLEVVSAVVKTVEKPTEAAPREYLLLRLRVRRQADPNEFAADPGRSLARAKNYAPRVTDDTGRVYESLDLPDVGTAEQVRSSPRFPLAVIDEEFVLEAPAASVESLRLEVAAAAWGGKGQFRFTIPRSLIRRSAPKSVRPGSAAGK
jgi:hypothetical protein